MRRDQSYVVSACLHELSIKETVWIFPQSIEHIPETLLMFINYSGDFDFVAVEKVIKRNVARIGRYADFSYYIVHGATDTWFSAFSITCLQRQDII